MSLETQVERLANAISANHEGLAVAEIIRQRDAAQAWAKKCEHDAEYYRSERDRINELRRKAERKIASLRGVITKMKNRRGFDD